MNNRINNKLTKVAFIAKTDINLDGRILNQIRILQRSNSNVFIDFILLADKVITIDLGPNTRIHEIKTIFRHNKFLRVFTVVDFICKTLLLLYKLKPDIVHAQDTSVVFPTYIYRRFRGSRFKLIYDDHELPNANESIQNKVTNIFEIMLMRRSDYIIFANKERLELIRSKYNIKNKMSYFLNLPYYDSTDVKTVTGEYSDMLEQLDELGRQGFKFIIHQGILEIERGRRKLGNLSKILPENFRLLMIGGSRADFDLFLFENELTEDKFFFVGPVKYYVLPLFWDRGIASVVMYLPTYINNRLCAPNRFYLSVDKCLPVIVNEDNPVLSDLILSLNCGYFIEDLKTPQDIMNILKFDRTSIRDSFDELKKRQIENFELIYNTI